MLQEHQKREGQGSHQQLQSCLCAAPVFVLQQIAVLLALPADALTKSSLAQSVCQNAPPVEATEATVDAT